MKSVQSERRRKMLAKGLYYYWFGGSRGALMYQWNVYTNVVRVIKV